MEHWEKKLRKMLEQEEKLPECVEEKLREAYGRLEAKDLREASRAPGRARGYRKRAAIAVLAATLTFGAAMGVMAATETGFFKKTVNEKEKGEQVEIEYHLNLNYELKPQRYQLELGYVPEGYQGEPTEGSAKLERGEGEACQAVSVQVWTKDIKRCQELYSGLWESVEHTTIQGLPADILVARQPREERVYLDRIAVFNQEEGYILDVCSNDLPIEEMKKIAENVRLTSLGEASAYEDFEEEEENLPIAQEHVIGTGETVIRRGTEPKNVETSLEKAEITETLENLPAGEPVMEQELKPYLQEDGRLAPVFWAEDGSQEWEESELVFVQMTFRAKNIGQEQVDLDRKMTPVLLEERDGELYLKSGYIATVAGELEVGNPVYLSADGDGKSRFHEGFTLLEPGEETVYTIAYAVRKADLENWYLADCDLTSDAYEKDWNYFAVS